MSYDPHKSSLHLLKGSLELGQKPAGTVKNLSGKDWEILLPHRGITLRTILQEARTRLPHLDVKGDQKMFRLRVQRTTETDLEPVTYSNAGVLYLRGLDLSNLLGDQDDVPVTADAGGMCLHLVTPGITMRCLQGAARRYLEEHPEETRNKFRVRLADKLIAGIGVRHPSKDGVDIHLD